MAGNAISFYKGQKAVRGQGHTTCVHHKGNTLDWFCEKCHEFICANCISTLHKGHGIVPLSEVTPNNKRKIKTFINETEQKELIRIQQEINSNQESLEKHISHFKLVAEEVKNQGMKLTEHVDVLIDETLSQLKHLEDENTQLLTSYKTELEKKLAELKDQLTHCKETLQNGTDIQVFDVTSRLHTDITLHRRPVLGTAKFSQSKHPNESLTSALGKMTLTSSGRTDDHVTAKVGTSAGSSDQKLTRPSAKLASPRPKIQVLSEWDYPCDIINICPASDDGVWAYGVDEKTLTHLTNTGTVQQQLQSPVRVTNVSMSLSTQTVWACSQEDNSVMELKSATWLTSSTLVRKFNTKDEPACLCVTKDDHVLVGIKHGIIKYNQRGMPSLMTTSHSKKPPVISPSKISECPVNGNVAVLDGDWSIDVGENPPLIVVMSKHLQELYRYGPHQHGSRTGSLPFHPRDVSYDRFGQLVVADYYNSCLHLLSGDGQYMGLMYPEEDRPLAVCVDRQEVLWVVLESINGTDKEKRLHYHNE